MVAPFFDTAVATISKPGPPKNLGPVTGLHIIRVGIWYSILLHVNVVGYTYACIKRGGNGQHLMIVIWCCYLLYFAVRYLLWQGSVHLTCSISPICFMGNWWDGCWLADGQVSHILSVNQALLRLWSWICTSSNSMKCWPVILASRAFLDCCWIATTSKCTYSLQPVIHVLSFVNIMYGYFYCQASSTAPL